MPNFEKNDITSLSDSMIDTMFKVTIIHEDISSSEAQVLSARCTGLNGPDTIGAKVKTLQFGNFVRHQVDQLNNSAGTNKFNLTFVEDAQRVVSTALKKINSKQREKDFGIMLAADSSLLKFSVLVELYATDGETVVDAYTYTGCLMDPLPNLNFDRAKADSGNINIPVGFHFEDIERD